MSRDHVKIRRALLSVSDKTGLIELATALDLKGVELLSTGGTAKSIRDAGLPVKDVSDITGFPEMMDGRVKTLHPMVHGGLLALRDNKDHLDAMNEHGIIEIDLLVVNLYPFEETVSKGGDYESCIENIDIGGPAMIRAAAKNHGFVSVVVDVEDYNLLIQELDSNGMPIIEETTTLSGLTEIVNVDDLDQCENTTDDATGEKCPSSDKRGWYIKLKDFAKGSAEPTVFAGRVYFPIYEPTTSTNVCNTGKAILTAYDTKCGNSVLNVHLGTGVLSKVVVQGDNLYIGLAGEAKKNIAGFTSTGNLITGKSQAKGSGGKVQLEGWKEN